MSLASLSVFCVVLGTIFIDSSASRDISQEMKPLPDIFMKQNLVSGLTEIPKHFEVKKNAQAAFNRYIGDIESIAKEHNYTVRYKVKVLIDKNNYVKKRKTKLIKSQKYNVPLKKQNVGMTKYERFLRRLAEEKRPEKQEQDESNSPVPSYSGHVLSTKVPFSGKYRPVISKLKTNFTKRVKPVRNKVFTL